MVKEEANKSSSSEDDGSSRHESALLQAGAGKRVQNDDGLKPDSPNLKNLIHSKQGETKIEIRSSPSKSESRTASFVKRELQIEQLQVAKAEMDEVMEENQRLRMYLDRILKDYRTLQSQYKEAIQQEEAKRSSNADSIVSDDQPEESELVSLCLGRSSSETTKDGPRKTPINERVRQEDSEGDEEGLALGLECNFEVPKTSSQVEYPSPDNSLQEVRKETGDMTTWSPDKSSVKNPRSDGGDDELLQQTQAKRARVSVRYRCDTPTMHDGCQWRKYGQKISKGNPCPRAYYRCTVAPSCPVRKQVQRCVEDMSILITTYEGTHNHPLPISATAMASTTSAAVSMLMSGSSTSGVGPCSSSIVNSSMTTSSTANLNGLNFLANNSRTKPFYLPSTSISSSLSYPTITLDLTSPSSTTSPHLNRLSNNIPPRFSSTNLNFSSLESSSIPVSWNNGTLGYGNKIIQTPNSFIFGSTQHNETLYNSFMQKNIRNPIVQQSDHTPDTIAAATKAITSDPSFQSALAAALTSLISSGLVGASSSGNQNGSEKPSQDLKSSEPFPILSSFPTTSSVNNSTSSQHGSLRFPSFSFTNSQRESNSPGDDRDHIV